jgi:hypothetical protein
MEPMRFARIQGCYTGNIWILADLLVLGQTYDIVKSSANRGQIIHDWLLLAIIMIVSQ